MFGYVRPFKGELLVKEYDAYKGVYCQVCKALGTYYGPLARMTLTYDCTFYAMLALNQRDAALRAAKKRCTCNPLKKCTYVCPANGDAYAEKCFHKAAALCVIMTAHKLRDNIQDEKFVKALGARFLYGLSRRAMKKAARDFPWMADAVQKMMDGQYAAEHADRISLDACSAPTAELLETLCTELGETAVEKMVLGQVGYFLGRWVYIMDAADDLAEDLKKKSFNPFVSKLGLSDFLGGDLPEDRRKAADLECNAVLNASLSRLIPAANLLPTGQFSGIINNILNQGLPEIQREILFLHVKDKKRRRDIGRETT
ncbi:MAG: hypothetical protein IJF56_09640 [Clostridia bacterium]|nr:hypothetical protein [Clostridia bacterium]